MSKSIISLSPADVAGVAAVSDGRSSRSVNMRLSADRLRRALVPVGVPVNMSATSMRPVYRFTHPRRGDVLLLASGTLVAALYLDECPGGVPVPLGQLSSLPRTVIMSGSDVAVLTDTGIEYIEVGADGDMRLSGPLPDFPPLRMTAYSDMTLTAAIDGAPLSGSYDSRSGRLSRADCTSLSSRLLDAYVGLCDKAASAGYSPQPVLARYRLLDAAGNTLYVSPLTMISARDGFQCVGEITIRSSDGLQTVDTASLTAECFRLGIKAPPPMTDSRYDRVAWMEVDCSRPIHPADLSGRAPNAVDRHTDSGASVRCFLPGTSSGMSASSAGRERMMHSAVNNADLLLATVARIASPYTGGLGPEGSVTAVAIPTDGVRNDVTALRKAIATHRQPRQSVLTRCSVPHRFSASVSASAPGVTVYADPSTEFFDGYPLQAFTHTSGAGDWAASVAVTLAGGEQRVVAVSSGTSDAPVLLSPILSYPDPTATMMTVRLRSASGRMYRQDFPLRAAPAQGLTFWIAPSLAPFELTAETDTFVIPASKKSRMEFAGTLLSARNTAPLQPVDAAEVSQRQIAAVVEAVRATASWDYTRRRFLIFGRDGIFMFSVDSGCRFLPAHRLDSRPVMSGAAVACVASGGRSAIVVAGGDIVAVDGNRTHTLRKSTDVVRLVRSQAMGELWCVAADGSVTVWADDMSHVYTRTGITVRDVFADGVSGYVTTADGELYDLSAERPVTMRCRWSVTVDMCGRASIKVPRVSGISAGLAAATADGAISLTADNGSRHPSLLSSLTVSGVVNHPLEWRVIAPPRRFVTVTLDAILSADAEFYSLKLEKSE